jgi:hypothetical protein
MARSLFAQILIAVVVCGGLYYFGVGSLKAKLMSAQATVQDREHEIAQYKAFSEAQQRPPEQELDHWLECATKLDQASHLAADSSTLYNAINAKASRFGVKVERVEPKGHASRSKRAADDDGPSIESISYTITFSGSYRAVVGFISALDMGTGMCAAESIRLIPSTDAKGNHVVYGTLDMAYYRIATTLADADQTGKGGAP